MQRLRQNRHIWEMTVAIYQAGGYVIWEGQLIQLLDNTPLLWEEKSAPKAAEMEKKAPAGLIESACVV